MMARGFGGLVYLQPDFSRPDASDDRRGGRAGHADVMAPATEFHRFRERPTLAGLGLPH
jgi:hypothetical protein